MGVTIKHFVQGCTSWPAAAQLLRLPESTTPESKLPSSSRHLASGTASVRSADELAGCRMVSGTSNWMGWL